MDCLDIIPSQQNLDLLSIAYRDSFHVYYH